MKWTITIAGCLLFALACQAPVIAQTPSEPDAKLKAIAEKLMRDNRQLRSELVACKTSQDAGGAKAADVAPAQPVTGVIGAKAVWAGGKGEVAPVAPPPPAKSGLKDSAPSRPSPSYSTGGGDKADQAQSPIQFPQVPPQTDWLNAHLQSQYSVLSRLYTSGALQMLAQQEQGCNDPRTGHYCKIRLRLHWISSAVR